MDDNIFKAITFLNIGIQVLMIASSAKYYRK